jgi:hypothetical protein
MGQDVPAVDGLYPGVHERVYHSDTRSLSHSGARAILPPGSPAAYKYWRDNYDPTHTTEAMNFGSAVHAMVLNAGPEVVVVGDDLKTKKTQDLWKTTLGDFNIPLRTAQKQVAQDMAAAVKQHRLAASLLDTDQTEISGWYRDEPTGVRLRFRVDALKQLRDGRFLAVDYKTCESADPGKFAGAAVDYGYYQQDPWYVAGLAACGIPVAGFLYVVQEKKPPYLVSVDRIIPEHVLIGAQRNRRAVDLYAECSAAGVWPGYPDGINDIELPGWFVRRQQQEVDSE